MPLFSRILHFFQVELSEADMRAGLIAAALFNVLGMLLERMILRNSLNLSTWPLWGSIAVGIFILVLVFSRWLVGRRRWISILFVLNAFAVTLALREIYAQLYANVGEGGPAITAFPFQATKLGTLIASMIAPSFAAGLAAIGLHVGVTVLQILQFPPDVRAALGTTEPWANLAFGLGGVFVLIYRIRVRDVQSKMLIALAEAESIRQLAEAFLEVRDRMNTPLQSIEIGITLLKGRDPDYQKILEQLKNSSLELHKINTLLKRYEGSIEWSKDRGGLGV